MTTYALTTDLIEKIEYDELDLYCSILDVFTNPSSPIKLAGDKNKSLLTVYANAKPNDRLKEQYKCWLEKLSHHQNKVIEEIDVEVKDVIKEPKDVFLKIAASYNGRCPIIVHTRGRCPFECDPNNKTGYNGKKVCVLDKDEAAIELNTTTINITNGANSPIITGNNNKTKL